MPHLATGLPWAVKKTVVNKMAFPYRSPQLHRLVYTAEL